MTYEETLKYMYRQTPAFHKIGAGAYKPGLERTLALDKLLGSPHERYETIHIAGTNGKGSVAHLIAALLQASGYRTGLYTSPHLIDFCERIRVNGKPISKQYVAGFVKKNMPYIDKEKPSFFELTSELAFDYFRHKKIRFAVIETGLGGRLDSTNIISPMMSIITSISLDHTDLLGNTLLEIAEEKAGIIKPYIPVVIGEMNDAILDDFFAKRAKKCKSTVYFARENSGISNAVMKDDGSWIYETVDYGSLIGELRGPSQQYNAQILLTAIKILEKSGVQIRKAAVRKALSQVVEMTGLMARWQKIHERPLIICDIGHNTGAWQYNSVLLKQESKHHKTTHIIFGMVKDKDVDGVLALLPKSVRYYFTQASIERAMPVAEFAAKAAVHGLKGNSYVTVADALIAAMQNAGEDDFIFIGGSTFVVSEAVMKLR